MKNFTSLTGAIRQGFQVEDRLVGGGYLLRQRTEKGWVRAVCEPREAEPVARRESQQVTP